MIPLAVPNLAGKEADYLKECIETTFVSSVGPFVTRFEEMVARASGTDHAVATSAGTTGLHAALVAVGVERDDLVVMPSFTFIATANAVAHCGATPWLFDVAAESWTIDPLLLATELATTTGRKDGRLVHKDTGRTVAAIMPVFTLGMPADMDPILAVAREHDLPVVVDAAAALGATYKGRQVANLGADLTVFSFNGNKTVTAGGGGAVAGADSALVQLVRHLSTTARVGNDYHHDRVGFNYRMTNIAAAVGCAQMERLDEFIEAKRRVQSAYNQAFGKLPGVGVFPVPAWAEGVCWLSGITLADAVSAATLRDRLREGGVDARPFWKPIHLQPPFADSPMTRQPVTDDIWSRIVTLPCSTGVTDAEVSHVIEIVRSALC